MYLNSQYTKTILFIINNWYNSSMKDVEFIEDKIYLSKLAPKEKIPQKGLEGWLYKKIPGKFLVKRTILIFFIFLLFVLSFVFFILGIYNQQDTQLSEFTQKGQTTNLK